jgi:DNA replication and repair protein RecF
VRSYARLELELRPGVVLVVGPNGAGKTNLLESVHLGTQGFSPRTRTDAEIVRFGESEARVGVTGERSPSLPVEVELTLRLGRGKEARLNGGRLRAAELLRGELAVLVFTPDRLAVVKGGPALRRAYFDRVLGRLFPARAALSAEYGAALGQRNAALRRVAAGLSSTDALAPWTARIALLAAELVHGRRETLALLSAPFAQVASELGLAEAKLSYSGAAPTVEEIDARLPRDLDRGFTGIGPHLDDVGILAGDRDLRSFGSQGEQRVSVLALLLAEAELLRERRGSPPLLLLDDVLSELDRERRQTLVRLLPSGGQTLVTATSASALPGEPSQLLNVRPGRVDTAV